MFSKPDTCTTDFDFTCLLFLVTDSVKEREAIPPRTEWLKGRD